MLASEQVRCHIRWMIRRDMPEIIAIEDGGCAQPWSEEDFLRCLRQRNCIGMVAEKGERVVGYMVYELLEKSLNLLRLAVHPVFRRKDVGGQMVRRLFAKLSSHRRTRILCAVPEESLEFQLFLRSQGFLCEGIARTEGLYLMKRRIAQEE